MIELREYQGEAVAAVVAALADCGRSQLHAACGTGKTLVALCAANRLCPSGGLVVVACPSLALVAQTVEVWAAHRAADRILAVCGDRTVGDAPVRIGDLPCPVTRDPAEIAAWLRQPSRLRRLLVATHKSTDVTGAGLTLAGARADLMVIDEAHYTAGRGGKHAAVVHHDQLLPAARRLYLTATPRYLTETPDGGRGDEAMIGMDDPQVFGTVCYTYPFGQAITDGWLDDYQVVVIGVTKPDVLTTLRQLDQAATLGVNEVPLRTAVVQTALARAAAEFDLRRVIAFTPRVAQAREFAITLPRTLRALPDGPTRPATAEFVHGGMSLAQRQLALDKLRKPPDDGWTVVANARCLAVGVDVPAVDGVLFTHPKKSTIDVVQAVGRALRKNPEGSGVATVIVPVLLPTDPEGGRGIDDQDDYRTLWQVVRALRAHDDTLGHELDSRRVDYARGGQAGQLDLPTRVLVRLPDGYDTEHYLRHITVRLLEQTTSHWLTGYAAACSFHEQHGHLRVPGEALVNNVRLAVWLRWQRAAHHAGRLSPERIAALERLGIVWKVRDQQWQAGLAAARRYHREHGHLQMPTGTQVDDVDLYFWLEGRKLDYQRGKLTPGRVAALDQLGIDWNRGDRRWRAGLAAAEVFHRQHGHLHVPTGTHVQDVDLAKWLHRQRDLHRRGRLAPERVAALDQLGIVWVLKQEQWQQGLAAARKYRRQHGHLRVGIGTRVDGLDLGRWLANKRTDYHRGVLAPERVRALEELGIAWRPFDELWERSLAAARAYRDGYGHLQIPHGVEINGIRVAKWLTEQKRKFRAGQLAPERVTALEQLGVEWN